MKTIIHVTDQTVLYIEHNSSKKKINQFINGDSLKKR